MAEKQKKLSRKLKIIIAVLLVLLILSVGALTARIVYLNSLVDKAVTTVVPDNLIEKESSVSVQNSEDTCDKPESNETVATSVAKKSISIELYKGKTSDNEKFTIHNMLPGDTEIKYFAVKVNHQREVDVFFNALVTEQSKNLANVLNIKVTRLENNNVIYNGSFADMDKEGYSQLFVTSDSRETVAYYKIEVSLSASAGNEYQAAKLVADFNWFVSDKEALDSPHTGDLTISNWLILSMLVTLTLIIILIFFRLKNKEDEYEE